MPIWLTAENCANINTLSDWLHTQEALCLSQEIMWRTLRNQTKGVSGFPIHTHKIKFQAFWVQMSNWLACLVRHYGYKHSLEPAPQGQHLTCRRWSLSRKPCRLLQHCCPEAALLSHNSKGKAQGSDLIDSPFWGAVLRGARWGHVERLCLPFQPGSFVGQHQAAPAWADDFGNELFAVYTHLHCTPVLHELFGKLEFFVWFVHWFRFWGKPGDTSKWPMVTSGGFFWPRTTFSPLQGRRSQWEDR